MLVMEKYSSEEGLGIRKIRDKRNKRRMNILGTEVYRRGNVRNEKSTMQGKNTGKYFIGYRYDRVRVSRGTNRNTGY